MEMYARPDRSVDRFDPEAGRSFTMPSSYYFDPAIYEREKTAIFWASWICVGHVSQLSEPGRYLTADVLGQRIFAIRNATGDLRAFFNVCMHRGHQLLEGTGSVTNRITCPYHAWAYGTDGQLKGARMSDRMEEFDYSDFTLAPVAVQEFCGFVFVNLSQHPQPMSEIYPGAEEAIGRLHDNPARLVETNRFGFEIAANWKNVGDNLLECYHCHPAHPAFVDLIDMDTYRNEVHENWSIQSGDARPNNSAYEVTSGPMSFGVVYLWPNTGIGRLPGVEGVSLFQFTPTAAEVTLQENVTYSPRSGSGETVSRANAYFSDILGPEDVALCESVQVGLHSHGYHQGRFICIPDRPEISEHSVHHFHRMVLDALDREDTALR